MASSLEQHMHNMHAKLQSNYIRVDEEWLSDCVDHFLQEETNTSLQALYDKTLEQWLLNDFYDIGVECLPDSVCNDSGIIMLNEKYTLQMQYVLDVAESAYDQLRQLRNQTLDETEDERKESKTYKSKKKRALKMELTDGKKTVLAMEYKPIPCLNTKLSPGCKMLILGPVRCANKVLMLGPKNIKVLGGEVDKYLIENSYENVLLRQTNQPINPNPRTDYSESIVAEEERRPLINIPVLAAAADRPADAYFLDDDDDLLMVDPDAEILKSREQSNLDPHALSGLAATAECPADELLLDDDDDLLMVDPDAEILKNLGEPNSTLSYAFAESIDYDINVDLTQMETQSNITNSPVERIACDEHVPPQASVEAKPTILDLKYPYKLRNHALVTIDQLLAIEDNEALRGRFFFVKAEIDRVCDRLQITPDEKWTVGVILRDSSAGELKVHMTDIIDDLGNTTAAEVNEMKRQYKDRPQLIKELEAILEDLKCKMANLNCFFKIYYPNKNDEQTSVPGPIAVELVDCTPYLEKMMSRKLCAEIV